jgi:hypothetical protein
MPPTKVRTGAGTCSASNALVISHSLCGIGQLGMLENQFCFRQPSQKWPPSTESLAG